MMNNSYRKYPSNFKVLPLFQYLFLIILSSTVPSYLIGQEDTTAPVLNDFSLSSTVLDVTDGTGYVSVYASVSDDLSGLDQIYMYFQSPSYEWSEEVWFNDWVSGELNYSGAGSLWISQFAESGEWTLEGIYLSDLAGNQIVYSATDLETLGFPNSLLVVSVEDSLPPEITAFSIAETEVDVTQGDVAIQVTISASDDLSGIKYLSAFLESPTGLNTGYVYPPDIRFGTMTYTYSGNMTIPQYAEPGIWNVRYLWAEDWNNNSYEYSASELEALGFSHTLNVISNQDTLAPTLLSLDINPSVIELISPDQDSISISISVSDEQSGVIWIEGRFVHSSEYGVFTFNSWGDITEPSTLFTGTKTILMNPSMRTGQWNLEWVKLVDSQSNILILTQAQLDSLGFPSFFIYGNPGPVYRVSIEGSDEYGDGSITNPVATIQKGIDLASNGDTVLVGSGVFEGAGNKNLYLYNNTRPKRIVLMSQAGPDSTIIDCEGDGRGLYLGESYYGAHDSRTVINGFTVQNGRENRGAGLYFSGPSTSPTITNCIIRNCVGAVSNFGDGGGGGGIEIRWGSSPTFINCVIENNVAENGWGGGINVSEGSPIFIKCLVTGNSAGNYGGGFHFFQESTPTLVNCTIANNTAPTGAGIYGGGYTAHPIINISNSIIWNNTPHQIRSDSTIISYSNIQGGQAGNDAGFKWQEGNMTSDPLFVDPSAGDFRLQNGSPCIDTGNPNILFNDMDGSRNDMGITGGGGLLPSFTSHDFAEIGVNPAGNNFKEIDWTVYNTDEDSIEITAASFSSGHFTLIEVDLPVKLAPFSSLSMKIRFQPLNPGIFTDNLTLTIAGMEDSYIEFLGQGTSASTIYGPINGHYTIQGSPFMVIDPVWVSDGDSLFIDPGVEFRFQGPYKLYIYGYFQAVGTLQDSIIFTRNTATETSKWGGIRFRGAEAGSEMAFCRIEYAKADESGYSYDVKGGGVYVGSTTMHISNCEISNNESRYGGGMAISGAGSGTIIENCSLTDNTGDSGGGIYLINTSPTIINTSIIRNSADFGAGIYMDNSSPNIQECIIMNNDAATGGGLYIVDGTQNLASPVLRNCLVAKNTAHSRASAVFCQGDSTELIFVNCTIADNDFKWNNGRSVIYSIFGAKILLVNTILSNNSLNEIFIDEDYPGSVTIGYSTIEGGMAVITGNTSLVTWLSGNLEMDPLFSDSIQSNYGLSPNSQAIDAGTALFELEGRRIVDYSADHYVGAAPDMGAYEMSFVYPGDTDNNGVVDAFDVLPIGIYFLESTVQRTTQDLSWNPRSVAFDSVHFARTLADVNGDGLVSEKDVIGIGVNWGNTHDAGVSRYVIDPNNYELIETHSESFTELFYSLSGQGEAARSMRSLLKSLLNIQIPAVYSLAQNYPNPFNPSTTIQFDLPEEAEYSIVIYDILGRSIWTYSEARKPAGSYSIQWDGQSDQGKQVSSGVYLISFSASEFRAVEKAVLIR